MLWVDVEEIIRVKRLYRKKIEQLNKVNSYMLNIIYVYRFLFIFFGYIVSNFIFF